MLSENAKMTRAEYLKLLPPIENPITVRLKFVKKGNLQYISHLDLQRTFNRILMRSGLPVWYTKGFNPHAKLVFSTPLSVGTQSIYEFLDLRMDRDMSCEKIMEMLNAELTDEMYITEAYIPTTKFSDIAYCEYEYEIYSMGVNKDTVNQIEELFSKSPLIMTKKTKSGEKEIDIVPLIKSLKAEYRESDSAILINAVLSAATENFLNPEMLMTAMKEKIGIVNTDYSKESYSIMRTKSYDFNLKQFK